MRASRKPGYGCIGAEEEKQVVGEGSVGEEVEATRKAHEREVELEVKGGEPSSKAGQGTVVRRTLKTWVVRTRPCD